MNGAKKGQTAVEFLMTYGWAVLIVMIMIAALFYVGVLNPRGKMPTSCTLPPGFSCYSEKLDSNGNLYLRIGQATGRSVTITGITCSNVSSATPSATSIVIPNGRQENVTGSSGIPCAGAAGKDVYRGYIIFTYQYSGSAITYRAEGDIAGPLEGRG